MADRKFNSSPLTKLGSSMVLRCPQFSDCGVHGYRLGASQRSQRTAHARTGWSKPFNATSPRSSNSKPLPATASRQRQRTLWRYRISLTSPINRKAPVPTAPERAT